MTPVSTLRPLRELDSSLGCNGCYRRVLEGQKGNGSGPSQSDVCQVRIRTTICLIAVSVANIRNRIRLGGVARD